MATVLDVAKYILQKQGPMTAMKLQKLVYYSQAWSLVWDEKPLFRSRIEAWANGPVVRALFDRHRQKFKVCSADFEGDPGKLTPDERETIDAVLRHYGSQTAQQLVDLTHSERPWLESRKGLKPEERGNQEIPLSLMDEYYSSL